MHFCLQQRFAHPLRLRVAVAECRESKCFEDSIRSGRLSWCCSFLNLLSCAGEDARGFRVISLAVGGWRRSARLRRLVRTASHFPLQLPFIRNAIFDQLVTGGYYEHRPDRTRIIYALKGIFLGSLMAFIGGVLAHQDGADPTEAILAGLLTGATVLVFGWRCEGCGAYIFSTSAGWRSICR